MDAGNEIYQISGINPMIFQPEDGKYIPMPTTLHTSNAAKAHFGNFQP